jgi:hypothetical protein
MTVWYAGNVASTTSSARRRMRMSRPAVSTSAQVTASPMLTSSQTSRAVDSVRVASGERKAAAAGGLMNGM